MTAEIVAPFEQFRDINGNPLEDGSIYVGAGGVEPMSNQVQVYWDAALTIPATQPIKTINGYTVRFGTPSEIFLDDSLAPYSIKVLDKKGLLVYSSLNEYGQIYDITTYINTLISSESLKYDSVASLKLASLESGVVVETTSYYSATGATESKGAAKYQIMTASEFTTATGSGSPDGYGDHLLANGNVAMLVSPKVYFTMYGALQGLVDVNVTENTARIQAAIDRVDNLSDKGGTLFVGRGNQHVVGQLLISGRYTTIDGEDGELALPATGSYTHLIRIANAFINIQNIVLNAQLNASNDCLLWVKAGYGQYSKINFRKALVAARVGESGVDQVSLSEMSFSQCITHECARALDIFGIFTVVNCIDCIFAAGENAQWVEATYDISAIRVYGGMLIYNGGQLNASPADNYPMIYMQTVLYTTGDYFSPRLTLSNCDIESPRQLIKVVEVAAATHVANRGWVLVHNNRIDMYYSQLPTPATQPYIIQTGTYFNGRMAVSGNHIYMDVPVLSRPFYIGANTRTEINFDDFARSGAYYGSNLAVYPGLPPQMGMHCLVYAYKQAAQAATTTDTVLFDTIETTVQGGRITLSDNYDVSTGIFTVPKGGVQSLIINAQWLWGAALGSSPSCWINYTSSSRAITDRRMAYRIMESQGHVTAMIPEAVEGDEIKFVVYTDNGGTTALNVADAYSNTLTIMGVISGPNG